MGSSPALRWAPPTFEEHRNEIILNENQPKGPLLEIIEEAEPEGGADTFKKTLICLEGNDPSSGEHYSIPLRSSQQRPNLPVFASPTRKQRTRRVSDP